MWYSLPQIREVVIMYTEIVKIIEGGLVNDKEKVINYAEVLANNLEQQGEISLAKKYAQHLTKEEALWLP